MPSSDDRPLGKFRERLRQHREGRVGLREAVDRLAGEAGWLDDSNRDTFCDLARRLLLRGFSVDEALALLSEAYHAVAREFGA